MSKKDKKKVVLFEEEEVEEGEVKPTKKSTKKSKQTVEAVEGGDLKINEEFAKKFEHNKRRDILDKAKEKYGEKVLLDEESQSSQEEEDDEGLLINAAVEKKFLETIAMIRANDPKLKET